MCVIQITFREQHWFTSNSQMKIQVTENQVNDTKKKHLANTDCEIVHCTAYSLEGKL